MVLRDDTLQSVAVRKLEAEVRMSLARALFGNDGSLSVS